MKKICLIIFVFLILLLSVGSFSLISGSKKNKINILVYGIDGRVGDVQERSDAIILANYDFRSGKIVATSIPRDSYVKITCKNNKYDKINHAYAYGGEKCLNETVSQLFEIKNVYNVVFGFDDVVDVVDYFGLIELVPNYSFCQSDYKMINNYCFEKGKKVLIDGEQALAYMRNRKSLPKGDIDRTSNQRQIFKILIEKFVRLGVLDKIKFYNYAKKRINTDLNISDINIKKIINVKQIEIFEYTLRGEDYINVYYYYKLDAIYLEKIKKYYY